ncbi:MAG: anhydro-N-acetylmuramic acid kinase [Gammaproteobacteria bacterium]|nr:anhydro-N-acetylmuramic acid kinase [Gammaproteobacteria bacterium]
MTKPVWAVGLMTGTVLDGMIDIAIIKSDGEAIQEFGPWGLVPYPENVKSMLPKAVQAALSWDFQGAEPNIFKDAEAALTQAQADAVNQFLTANGLTPTQIAVVGFHGQTVLHRAPVNGQRGYTRQLGDGQLMANLIGTNVVCDFRSADMSAGGQGAPLSAIYHQALLKKIKAATDTAVLNLGGVANISWWDGANIIAFDTGPANGPINDWVLRHNKGQMDTDGTISAAGKVNEKYLSQLFSHPYLSAAYPKSLDRYDFTATMVDGLGLEDGAATLAAFIAGSVDKALDLLPQKPTQLIVSGGGRKNPTIMRELALRTGAKPVSAESAGFRGDALEAETFAYLAIRSMRKLPISFPLTTGVKTPISGGVLHTKSKAG